MGERVIFEMKLERRDDRTPPVLQWTCRPPAAREPFRKLAERAEQRVKRTLDFFEELHEELYG